MLKGMQENLERSHLITDMNLELVAHGCIDSFLPIQEMERKIVICIKSTEPRQIRFDTQ